VHYPGTTDWWTIESSNARPSGHLNGGSRPTYLTASDVTITLRTRAMALVVSVLDGSGEPVSTMPVEKVTGGFRLHLNAASPWYSISAIFGGRPRR
jgi:hypothetical protein